MNRLMMNSYLLLIWVDLLMAWRGFPVLHKRLREVKPRTNRECAAMPLEELKHAMDIACVFYPKQVHCLQRSAATVFLFRQNGIEAEMMIGAQMIPFKSHAWVEVGGTVVNDKPYMRDIYQVLDRC